MVTEITELSSKDSKSFTSNLDNLSFKQFKRNYTGNFKINQVLALSALNDFKNKNYSNFYLTKNTRFSDVFSVENDRIDFFEILTNLQFGEDYLKFSKIDPDPYIQQNRYDETFNYGLGIFDNVKDDTSKFLIKSTGENKCQISYFDNNVEFLLSSDEDKNLFFIKKSTLPPLSGNKPYDFNYLYNEQRDFIYFFQKREDATYTVRKTGNILSLSQVDDDKFSILSNKFVLDRKLHKTPEIQHNTDYISYENDNTLSDLFDENLSNNFLIHNQISNSEKSDILVLKNQFSETNTMEQGNNLLSGDNKFLLFSENRDYTTISEDINQEEDDSLEINYVFYNTDFKIKPGTNYFTSPSSIFPFNTLNINDSKFIQCGSFSFSTPEYADKVYLMDDNRVTSEDQYLLCTWLSGSPNSDEKIWIDRYYYPDLITKQDALSGNSVYNYTYEDYIEDLIQTNSTLKESIDVKKFFDKKSDLYFKPNKRYKYERINQNTFSSLSSTTNICNNLYFNNINYFRDINSTGKFFISFYFQGSNNNWEIKSKRNSIDSGLSITKNSNNIIVEYKLFDSSNSSTTTFTITSPFSKLKQNFICISFDSIKGIYYVFLNNQIIQEENIKIGQFSRKSILYGDFYANEQTLLQNFEEIERLNIKNEFLGSDLPFVIPILDGNKKIEELTLTLPCGMRNKNDIIEYIHSVCGTNSFKSNNINIILKNLNISNEEIKSTITNQLTSQIKNVLPLGSEINNIKFENYI